MPKISDVTNRLEKKVDLSPFFGEEAFITIKKMGKYQFSLLLNKNRSGYSSKLFSLVRDFMSQSEDERQPNPDEYEKLRQSIPVEEAQERIAIENEVDCEYYSQSIKADGHNFTDETGEIIPITGEWFYKEFSGLVNSEGRQLNDFLINEIIGFNHKGIVLGE